MLGQFKEWRISTPLVLTLIVGLIVLATTAFGDNRFDMTVTEMLIRMVAVIGIYIFIGNSGQLSFGHVGFMCLGAYTAAWVTCDPLWKGMMLSALPDILKDHAYGVEVSVSLAVILCMALALVLGLVFMRLSGIASTITTFGFLIILNSVFSNWGSLTAGTSSIIGIPTVVTPGWALLSVIAALLVAWVYQNSKYGLMLRAVRESEPAALACGIPLVKMRLGSFVLSAGVCGGAGALYAHFVGFLSPDALYLDATFILLSMLIVGGLQSLSGAVMGTIAVSLLIEVLRYAENGVVIAGDTYALASGTQQLGLAAVLALVLLIKPQGLTGGREFGWPRSWRAGSSAVRPQALSGLPD